MTLELELTASGHMPPADLTESDTFKAWHAARLSAAAFNALDKAANAVYTRRVTWPVELKRRVFDFLLELADQHKLGTVELEGYDLHLVTAIEDSVWLTGQEVAHVEAVLREASNTIFADRANWQGLARVTVGQWVRTRADNVRKHGR